MPSKLDTLLDEPEKDSGGISLTDLDSIFSDPIGTTTTTTQSTRSGRDRGIVPTLGLSRQEERGLAAGAGALAGPVVKKGVDYLFPGSEARTAEGAKKLQEQQRITKMLQNMRDEELLRLGIKPTDLTPSSTTSGTKWIRGWAGMDKTIEGGVPEAAAAYQRSKGQGKITGRMTKKFGPLEPGQSLVDKLMQQSAANETAAAARAEAEAAANAAAKAKLAEATPGPLSRVSRVLGSPAVGGATAGLSFYDAYRRFMDGDRTGAVISALGGAAGIAALFGGGFPAAAIGLATVPAGMAYDWYQDKKAAEEQDARRQYYQSNPVAQPPLPADQ